MAKFPCYRLSWSSFQEEKPLLFAINGLQYIIKHQIKFGFSPKNHHQTLDMTIKSFTLLTIVSSFQQFTPNKLESVAIIELSYIFEGSK